MGNDYILEKHFEVTSADTDFYKRLKLGSLLNYLIQSAVSSAEKLGFGFENLNEVKLFWVLSRMNIKIEKPVYWGENLVVETWPRDIDRLLYIRDFIVKNQKGDIVATATSSWLAIDLVTKRPKVVDKNISEIFTSLKDKYGIKEYADKLPKVNEGINKEISTSYFDLDLNRHVTSTRYIDWMMDSFELDFHKNKYPNELQINYMKETLPGEQILLNHFSDKTLNHSFSGKNTTNNIESFRGKIDFRIVEN